MMHWDAAAVLAAIVWLNGVQCVDQHALVLRRVLGGSWAAAAADSQSSRWRVVAWWAPLTASLVLPSGPLESRATPAEVRRAGTLLTARLRRSRPYRRALCIIGVMELAAFVFGLSWATAQFGALGLASGMVVVLVLAAATAGTAAIALCRIGAAPRTAARAVLSLLSPFGAPRAADMVLERAVAGAPPELVARALLPRDAFLALVRPRAYDLVHACAAATSADGVSAQRERTASLVHLLDVDSLASLVESPPRDRMDGEPFCPRCGTLYRPGVTSCVDCEGVTLILSTSE